MDYQLIKVNGNTNEQIAVGTLEELSTLISISATMSADDPKHPAYYIAPLETEWITRKAAMEILGVNKSRMSQLVSSGKVRQEGKLVSLKDVEKQSKFAGKAGARRTVTLWDQGNEVSLDVTRSEELDQAELIWAWVDEIGSEIAILLWDDGTVMTTIDWTGEQPQDVDEIEDYSWMVMDESGMWDTIFLDGLPRDARL